MHNIIKKTTLFVVLLLVGLTALKISTTIASARPGEPPHPEWILPDGRLDRSRLPACIELAGPDGQTVKNEKGEPVCIPSSTLFDLSSDLPPVGADDTERIFSPEGVEFVPIFTVQDCWREEGSAVNCP
jgi:hypothetical protein